MNSGIIFNILLYCDVNTIIKTQQIYEFKNIQNEYFWTKKFKHDNLINIVGTYDINEYIKIYEFTSRTNNLINESLINPEYDGIIIVNFNDNGCMEYSNIE